MRRIGLSALVMLLIAQVLTLATVAQEGRDPAQTKIIALEKAWNQAFKFRDKKALAEILDSSIVLINDDGTIQTRSAFMALVDTAPPSDEQQAEPESISVHVFGDVAVATGIFMTKGVEKGRPYVKRIRFADTWMNKDGVWVCIAAAATLVQH